MRRFALFLALALCITVSAYAHPGGTDSKGGHTNHSTGEYHYHHGNPEHQHVNGFCPYATVTPTPRATPRATPKVSLSTLPPSAYQQEKQDDSKGGNVTAALAGAGGTAITIAGYSFIRRLWKS